MSARKTSVAEIRACVEAGLCANEAARKLDIDPKTARLRAERLGLKFVRKGRLVAPTRDNILAAMRAGAETSPKIAEAVGMKRSTVSVFLNQAERRGVVRRLAGGSLALAGCGGAVMSTPLRSARFHRKRQILEAIRDGHLTAASIAQHIGITRNNASVLLQRMFGRGEVLRGRPVCGERGRPAAVWFVAEARA